MADRRAYSPTALEAARLLGAQVRLARRERGWTLHELAERVGVTRPTMSKIERGDPSVGLGVALEAAALTGVPLFLEDRSRVPLEAARLDAQLALLPQLVRKPAAPDDDF
jgi:transcriptional regulator with XRE-family HTH domain